MAPGLNGRQTGTVPKNKTRSSGAQSHRSIREPLMQPTSGEWEPVLDQNSRARAHRKLSSAHSETEADSIRYDLAGSLSSAMASQLRFEENMSEGNNADMSGSRIRVLLPDKKQVINKITQIQDYIQQTATLMNALKTSDCPEKKNQYDQLSTILTGLQDSEAKLNEILKNLDEAEPVKESLTDTQINQGDAASNHIADGGEEELVRRTEDSKRKLELLQKRKQELLELQDKARKQLQEAQLEQSRLVARASSLNQDINSNGLSDLNVQQLSQRIKNAQQLFKTSNQIAGSLIDSKDSNAEEPEHLDEDQAEISDTETDTQIVSDKVAELNMMKSQLAHIQKIMANISFDSTSKDGTLGASEERREQGQQQRPVRNESSAEEASSNAIKLEQAKLKLNQLTQLLEIAQSVQNAKALPTDFLQVTSNTANEEGDSIRRSPSPGCSSGSHQRPSDEVYVETMQLMTRELEERTAAVKEEHERLIAARQEIENLARKLPLVKAERVSLSPDDSGSEAPCLTNISLDSSGRLVNSTVPAEQICNDRSLLSCRAGHSKIRQRGGWNAFVPSMSGGTQEKKCKNGKTSRSLQHIAGLQNIVQRDSQRWSPSPTVSFCDNASCSGVQAQNHFEKPGNMCTGMLNEIVPRPVRPEEISVEELYTQHEMLTRTVAQCSHLLWLQQKQIIELRNALMLQQSTMFQTVLPQSAFFGQPQRSGNLPPQSFQFNPVPAMPYPSINHPSQIPLQQENHNYLPPNQSLKLNSSALTNIQASHEFSEQFYQPGSVVGLPMSIPDSIDCQFRFGNYPRPVVQPTNSNSNVNLNLNQSEGPCLNNRIAVGGVSCLSAEDSGALNNQVPPGNRANNYWDNFRSYSRQNLLSHSKSNEDSEATRRTSTSANQERPMRETMSITIQNNTPAGSSNEIPSMSSAFGTVDPPDFDEYQFSSGATSSASRPVRVQASRSRSAETQSHRNTVKNESRNQENDSRNLTPKNESTTSSRTRNPEGGSENIRSLRNDVSQGVRNSENSCISSSNFVQLVRDIDDDEGRHGINKKRLDKTRTRNEGCGNLNNRANFGLPSILRDNVYSEVTNFIRTNENHPHFLIQLFRDLQQVTTDPLRQRTLESIQETVSANNLSERSNINGANLNIIENRNNIRESRSNLNRNQPDEPNILDDIVCQLRENQNTIRQNIGGNSALASGGNLENPNISNLRNLGNPRNNLQNEGLRDLRTYFEANLCNFGHNSALENPNLSNIRENLTRRGTATSELENANPKNLYLSIYDNAGRRNQDAGPEGAFQVQNCRNSEQLGNDFAQGSVRGNSVGSRSSSNQFPLASAAPLPETRDNFCESRQGPSKFLVLERENYENSTRDFVLNDGCTSADNFGNDPKKRSRPCEVASASKNNGSEENEEEEEGATALMPPDWDRNISENRCYITPVNPVRNEVSAEPICDVSSCNCKELEQLDNRDLAEADQTRNEESSAAESNNCFVNTQAAEIIPGTSEANNFVVDAESDMRNVRDRRPTASLAPESNFGDIRDSDYEIDYYYENYSHEYHENFPREDENAVNDI